MGRRYLRPIQPDEFPEWWNHKMLPPIFRGEDSTRPRRRKPKPVAPPRPPRERKPTPEPIGIPVSYHREDRVPIGDGCYRKCDLRGAE